jgi:hypothetical protein
MPFNLTVLAVNMYLVFYINCSGMLFSTLKIDGTKFLMIRVFKNFFYQEIAIYFYLENVVINFSF